MASNDWATMANSLTTNDVLRAVSTGYSPPPGGGTFTRGFGSQNSTHDGAVGEYMVDASANPTSKGGMVSGGLVRSASGASKDFTVFLVLLVQAADVQAEAYLLGFAEDVDPAPLLLVKGKLTDGIRTDSSKILMQSNATYDRGDWQHVRMDAIVQPGTNDVDLQVRGNDLDSHDIDSPVWAAIAGMTDFCDDALGHNSGSPGFTSGRIGIGFRSKVANAFAYVDHIVAWVQN